MSVQETAATAAPFHSGAQVLIETLGWHYSVVLRFDDHDDAMNYSRSPTLVLLSVVFR